MVEEHSGAVVGSTSGTILHDPHQPASSNGPDVLPSVSGSSVVAGPVTHASAASIPVRVTTVDGLVSTFSVTNVFESALHDTQSSATYQGPPLNQREFHLGDGSSNVPIILDFSGTVPNVAHSSRPTRPGVARVVRTRSRAHAGQPSGTQANISPMQGPIALPQREGAPVDYKYFGKCDRVCQRCNARFWWEERRSGLPASATPQHQRWQIYHLIGVFCPANDDTPRFLQLYIYDTDHEVRNRLSHFHPNERQTLREDIVQGLIDFLDDNNALVHLFRTAREKLREADIPNFNIRLFGVVGATQYELPTADSIGAIIFEGGPETLTDYDVVIERHSREPESVNKLHPQYMALQFPLLFIYGEEGYHLKLRLKNSDPLDTQDEKKMTMKIYYAYQLFDRRVLFTQEVLILQVDTAYDWYYQKCSECGGKLDYGYVHGHCHPYGTESKPQNSYSFRVTITDSTANAIMTCFSPQTDGLIKDVNALLKEVGNKDPAVVPPQILALQNTRHVFQFKFAKPSGKGAPTLVLQKVMDHPIAMLPASAAEPSSPPVPSPAADTFPQITPPPTTPATTQETPTDTSTTAAQLTTSAIRRQLFTDAADKDIDPESKKQKIE
ncbi:DNA helicase Pif1-like protein [Artemisia annua]|uniref:DNA helicase Pif1-like protein n=1 Tax=Artemisia annua TaxID=35608 RepID=A0A2U1MMC8_ARTAN|nr:DNA helicase Pif1-like protein [Artemisia annua]